jgi:TusA-related sulfurtransferase
MSAHHQLDTLGLFCPIPVILTAKKIKEMEAGAVLTVLSDDPGIKKDMPIWCEQTGNPLLNMTEETASEGIQVTCTIQKKN